MNQKRGATSPAQVNQGKKPDEKDSPTSPSTGLFGYLFSGGAQKSVEVTKPLNNLSPINLSPVGKLQGNIDITSESFLRAYEEESRANLERWSPNKTPSRPESGRIQQARDEPSWANRTPETERSPNKEIANVESEPNKGETWASKAAKQKQMEERGASLQMSQVEPVFAVENDGAMREELEVEIESINGKPYKGTIPPLEAKHAIYRDCLGLDFKNFDGVRNGYRGAPVLIFKLKKAMNVDDLLCVQFFEYTRTYTSQGQKVEDKIGCKIRGLRSKPMEMEAFPNENHDDGTRIVQIEGCEYRVPEEEIVAWLELYGSVESELVENCFNDADDLEGTNRTGSYSVKMKLNCEIPQMLPMAGRRVKMYYRGIQKLCTNCFGHHNRRGCQSRRVPWIDYVKNFVDKNPNIPRNYFGKWMDILHKVEKTQEEKSNVQTKEHTQKAVKEIDLAGSEEVELNEVTTDGGERGSDEGKGNESAAKMPEQNQPKPPTKPKPSDFNVPETDEEYDRMVEGMMTCGMRFNEAEANLKTRKTAYNRAVREYDRDNKPPVTRKAPGKARKSSF